MPSNLTTFPRTHRLSGQLAFAKVYDAKVKQSRGPLVAFSLQNQLNHPRLGISISRRVGIAAKRNRIKRMIREAFRAHQNDLPNGYDFVVVVRPHDPLELADYQRLLSTLMTGSRAQWVKRSPSGGIQ
jgi:ribonuclease P protein component